MLFSIAKSIKVYSNTPMEMKVLRNLFNDENYVENFHLANICIFAHHFPYVFIGLENILKFHTFIVFQEVWQAATL